MLKNEGILDRRGKISILEINHDVFENTAGNLLSQLIHNRTITKSVSANVPSSQIWRLEKHYDILIEECIPLNDTISDGASLLILISGNNAESYPFRISGTNNPYPCLTDIDSDLISYLNIV